MVEKVDEVKLNMKTTTINVQLKNGNAVLQEIPLSVDDAEIIKEAMVFYARNVEQIQKDMTEKGCVRLRDQAFYLRSDINDIMDKLK